MGGSVQLRVKFVAMVSLVFVGCSEPMGVGRVAQVKLAATRDTVEVGQTIELTAVALGPSGDALSEVDFEWSSSDVTVAEVNDFGQVAARAVGTARIGARVGNVEGSRFVTVVPVRVATVRVSPDTATLLEGQSRPLSAAVLGDAGTPLEGRAVRWSTSDAAVAIVSEAGVVLARSEGEVRIEAEAGGARGTAQIKVVEGAVPDLRLEVAGTGFGPAPTALAAPSGDARLFVASIDGQIWVTRSGQPPHKHFLDLRDRVLWEQGTERGFYSAVFHPRYARNGYLFVTYADRTGSMRIERYTVSSDPEVADRASSKLILTIPHPPTRQHYGGALQFGSDGKLYIGTGDGGPGHEGNSQDRNSLSGKLLRIDVDAGEPYAIPSDNPFVATAGARGEIWALGLRNPWRFSFDRETRLLYVSDVGERHWEEVNVIAAGKGGVNFGWPRMEGDHCYPAGSTCDKDGLTGPVLAYPHPGNAGASAHPPGCSITGGHVYRGTRMPGLRGHYFYGDLCQGWVRSFRLRNGIATDQRQWTFPNLAFLVTMGEDAAGELYLLPYSGTIYRIRAAGPD